MASRNIKRKRATVSYREPSTDEELLDDSGEEYVPKKKPALPQRRSARRAAPSYKETSTDEEPESDGEAQVISAGPRLQVRQSAKPKPQKTSPSKAKPKQPQKRKRVGILGAPVKLAPKPVLAPVAVVSDGKIPSWDTLPYHIQLQIFVYAAHDDSITSSVSWLWHLALAFPCFREAALTALYRNPPISALDKPRATKLVKLLSEAPSAHSHNYQVMVKRLELDATKLSSLTTNGNSNDDLAALILSLKTLQDIDIFDPLDRPPYRQRSQRIRWHYPDQLFTALHQLTLQFKNWIKSWRWNASLCKQGPLWIKEVHSDDSFAKLQEITYTHFDHVRNRSEEDDEPTMEELVASGLGVLTNLKSLTFESCTVVNEGLLPLLPHGLSSLNFTNCAELDSSALQAFLLSHGSRLKSLTLNHNQSLDISFLVDLKRSCPRLESLRMDLNYYNSFATTHDSDPKYDEVSREDEIPTWPATLRVIEMEYLRKWSTAAAKTFFNSLIESAEDLPDLRVLVVTAILLDMNWRDRAEFRQTLIDRFQRIFLRKLTPPNTHLASFRAFREWKAGQASSRMFVDVGELVILDKEDDHAELDSNSDVPILLSRRAKGSSAERPRTRARVACLDSQPSQTSQDAIYEATQDTFIHGRCRVVDIKVDNLRPREEIWSEGDFLDPEASGDEDWNEDQPTEDEDNTYVYT